MHGPCTKKAKPSPFIEHWARLVRWEKEGLWLHDYSQHCLQCSLLFSSLLKAVPHIPAPEPARIGWLRKNGSATRLSRILSPRNSASRPHGPARLCARSCLPATPRG